MRLPLSLLYVGVLSSILPSTSALSAPVAKAVRGGTGSRESPSFEDTNQMFRQLKKKDGKGEKKEKKGSFECPENSAPIAGRRVKSMDDCVCDLGYFRESNTCTAEKGLCTEDYANEVEEKIQTVEFWIAMAESEDASEETEEAKKMQLGYIDKMNEALEDAWIAYNLGSASCAVWGADDLVAFEAFESGNRLLLDYDAHRELFFRKLLRGIKNVVKKAIEIAVKVVETVVDVVVELVECGVGIVKDGLVCGAVGCAFGLVGIALDVAFTIATGGVNKLVSLACDLSEFGKDDGDDEEEKSKKQNVAISILNGIGGTVCAVNEKVDSPVLAKVCDLSEVVEDQSVAGEALDVAGIIFDPSVLRFLEAFKTAMCGSPGSAVLDLLEEVVVCEIDCADENNVFCPA